MASRPPTEQEVVARAKRGDDDAFAQLVRPHEEIAFRTALIITRNAADAEDAAQEAVIKAFRALGRFRADAPFRPWLLAIVANEARNRRRSAGRRESLALRAATQALSGGAAPSPEGAVIAADDRARLLQAVEGLADAQRLVVSCRFFVGLNEEETAAVLGIRRGTVKSRLARALERLREAT